jgi:hypothetical protein
MENDGPVVGLDAPTAKSNVVKLENRGDWRLLLSCLRVIQDHYGCDGVFTSASPRCLNSGDVDLVHRHHHFEGTLGLTATSRKRIG